MGYLGRRIGKAQNQGDSNPSGTNGAVGGGILDLFAHGYFEQQGDIYNAPGTSPQGMTATGGVISDYATPPGAIYRAHIFTGSGIFEVTDDTSEYGSNIEYLVVAGGGAAGTNLGGGGGAGGLRTNVPGTTNTVPESITAPAYPVSNGQYTVVVGAGGAGVYTAASLGQPGNNSEFYPTPVSYPSTARIRSVGGGGSGGGNTDHPLQLEQVVLVEVLLDMELIPQEDLEIQQIQIIQNVKDLIVVVMVLVMEITTLVEAVVVRWHWL